MRKCALTVLAALLLVALTSCTPRSGLSRENPVTLTLWHVYGEQADAPMNRLVEQFNATLGQEKGILVAVTNVTSTSKIGEQLEKAIAGLPGAPDIPDLFSAHTSTAAAIDPERLLDWSTCFSKEELSCFVPEFLDDGRINGRLSVFPISKSSYALFVNGSQFERFCADTGVTYADLSTWDGFFEAAAAYYAWSGGKPFCAFDYLIRHVELDIMARGAEVRYTEDGWYELDDPTLKDAWMRFAIPFSQGHIAVADKYANTQVMTGETLAGIGSTAAIHYYNDVVTYPDNTSEPMNLQVLPLPQTDGGRQYMPQTGVGLCAWKTTQAKAEAAGIFVRWLTEGHRNLDFVAETGYMPVRRDAFDAIEDYAFSKESYEELYAAVRLMYESCTPVVRPDFDGFYDRTNRLYDGLRRLQPALKQRSDAGEAAQELAGETWDLLCAIQ